MGSIRVSRAVLLPVALLGAACSLFVPLDGLTSPDSPDAAASDAAADAAVDGTASADAASDGGESPCAVSHLFCDDFEQGVPDVPGRWSSTSVSGATIAADDSDYRSPSHSARFEIADSDGGSFNTSIDKKLPGTSAITCAFDMKLVAAPDDHVSLENFLAIGATPPMGDPVAGWDFEMQYRMDQDGVYLQDFATASDGGTSGTAGKFALTRSEWHHLSISADGAAHSVTVTVDGNAVYAGASLYPSNSANASLTLRLTGSGTGPWSILYDDVVCDAPGH